MAAAAVASAAVMACGVLDCEPRSGMYRVDATERAGGTCGDLGEVVFRAGEPGGAGAAGASPDIGTGTACINVSRESADRCTVEIDTSCRRDGAAVAFLGSVDWSQDGSEGTGLMAMTLKDSTGILCASTYDLRYTRP